MIQPNELRIGNWVKIGDAMTTIAHIMGDEDFFEPIPLTPEILEKSGFESIFYSPETYKKEFGFPYVKGFTSIEYNTNGGLFKYGKSLEHGDGARWDRLHIKIQYLHQLQNLYQLLVGEELDITL